MLRPRCACSNLAAHAQTSLRLLQPRCACADLAAHLTDLAAHALMLRMLRASLRMLQNLAAHALTPNLAAHAPRVTTVYTRRKKLIFVNNMFIFRFLFMRIKSSCFFLGGLPWKVHFFSLDFWPWKKNTPMKNTNKPCKRECRNHFLSLKIFGKSHVWKLK